MPAARPSAALLRRAVPFLALLLPLVLEANAQQISVITHPENQAESLSYTDLKRIFRAERQFWSGRHPVRLAMLADGHSENLFIKLVYGISPRDLEMYWTKKIFRGEVSEPPRRFGSVAEVVQFVADTPGAIAFIPSGHSTPSVNVVSISMLPGKAQSSRL